MENNSLSDEADLKTLHCHESHISYDDSERFSGDDSVVLNPLNLIWIDLNKMVKEEEKEACQPEPFRTSEVSTVAPSTSDDLIQDFSYQMKMIEFYQKHRLASPEIKEETLPEPQQVPAKR